MENNKKNKLLIRLTGNLNGRAVFCVTLKMIMRNISQGNIWNGKQEREREREGNVSRRLLNLYLACSFIKAECRTSFEVGCHGYFAWGIPEFQHKPTQENRCQISVTSIALGTTRILPLQIFACWMQGTLAPVKYMPLWGKGRGELKSIMTQIYVAIRKCSWKTDFNDPFHTRAHTHTHKDIHTILQVTFWWFHCFSRKQGTEMKGCDACNKTLLHMTSDYFLLCQDDCSSLQLNFVSGSTNWQSDEKSHVFQVIFS